MLSRENVQTWKPSAVEGKKVALVLGINRSKFCETALLDLVVNENGNDVF